MVILPFYGKTVKRTAKFVISFSVKKKQNVQDYFIEHVEIHSGINKRNNL